MSGRLQGQRWTCECGERLVGALTVNGKVAPITVADYDDGNVWLGRRMTPEGPDGYEVICAVLAGPLLEKGRESGMALHRNHFYGCPLADRFRPS